MTYRPTKPERNRAIAEAYRAGALMSDIAREHGISLSRVSAIIRLEDAHLVGDEYRARQSATLRRRVTRPEARAKISAVMRRRWAAGERLGRRAIFCDDPAKREEYLALRDYGGAAYARKQMGIAA